MFRALAYRKHVSGIMLLAFCAATIVFQNLNLKNYYTIDCKNEASIAQSFNGQLGLLEEETKTPSNNFEEEEDDEFKTESFLVSLFFEDLNIQYRTREQHFPIQHHTEIVSPPPQA